MTIKENAIKILRLMVDNNATPENPLYDKELIVGTGVSTDDFAASVAYLMHKGYIQARWVLYNFGDAPSLDWRGRDMKDFMIGNTTGCNTRYLTSEGIVFHEDSVRNDSSLATRQKGEKFGILDAPGLLRKDLEEARGIQGISCIYIDIDNFKALNTQFSERAVDQYILKPYQMVLRDLVSGVGFAYAEG